MKYLVLIAVLSVSFACQSAEIQLCRSDEAQMAKFISGRNCPDGYMFELQDGTRIFADFTAFRETHSVPDSVLLDLKRGDKVMLQVECYSPDEDPYQLVEILCLQKEILEYDERVRLVTLVKK